MCRLGGPYNNIDRDVTGYHCFGVDFGNIQSSSRCSYLQSTDSTPLTLHIIVKLDIDELFINSHGDRYIVIYSHGGMMH